jgi:Predicted RNA methylase
MFKDLVDNLEGAHPKRRKILDVPFVPTDDGVIRAMLKLAGVGRRDVLYDLGCGDGRILVAAAKAFGTRGVGIDVDPVRIADAMEYAGNAGVEYLVDFVEENIFHADISGATVVTLYLLDTVNLQLRPRLLNELRAGTRIVSHAFDMGDWEPDEHLELGGISLYKWIVPAQVAGEWEWNGLHGEDYRIALEQRYQRVWGTAWRDETPLQLDAIKLQGATLVLSMIDDEGQCQRFEIEFDDGDISQVWDTTV